MFSNDLDVFEFINSKDIKEHLKKIDYKFNSLEAAWLIYQCKSATIEEKHTAWKELIRTMPDCKIEKRMNTIPQESLHGFLRKFIDYEEKIFDEYFTPTENWIYTVEWLEQNTWFSSDKLYKTFEKAQQELLEEFKDWERKYIYRITKQKLESKQYITVYFDKNNEPYDYGICEYPEELTEILYGVFDGLWFDFPTPFRKGDILCQYDLDGKETSGFCRGPFVMKGITPDEGRDWTRKDGDTTDMNAWGYFQYDDGTIYYEVMYNYMNLEYYRGELIGKRRIIKALSNFIKEKIDVVLFSNAYHYILGEEHLKENMPSGYTKEGLELAGIEGDRK